MTKLYDTTKVLKDYSLPTLKFYGNSIRAEGTTFIVEALKTNTALTTLYLWSNKIGAEGVRLIAEALKTNNSLTILDLEDYKIGDEGATFIAEALKTNNSLTHLDLGQNSIGATGAQFIADSLKINNSLTSLGLEHNYIRDAGAKLIADSLKINNSLTILDLGTNWLGDEGAKFIAEALKTNNVLKNLNLGRNYSIGAEGGKLIAEALKTNTALTHLDLGGNKIGDAGALAIAEVLKTNNSLTILDLGYSQIGDAGSKLIAETLKTNNSLKTLKLGSNKIGDAGAKFIAEALKTNNSLTSLDLYFNPIGAEGALAIAEALKTNTSLTLLNLNDNYIGAALISEIQGYIKRNINDKILEANNLSKQVDKFVNSDLSSHTEEVGDVKEEVKLSDYDNALKSVIVNTEEVGDIKEEEFEMKDHHDHVTSSSMGSPKRLSNLKVLQDINELVREGNDKINGMADKAILLLGKTGAGKSTLANLLAGRKLQAIYDDEVGELVIDAVNPVQDIIISHNKVAETKIPNKAVVGDVLVWDCPGFSDNRGIAQEIANGFYIKKLFETSKAIKFVLVVPESSLVHNRGTDFVDTVNQLMRSFTDITAIRDSISLVVTQSDGRKTPEHIRKSIERIVKHNDLMTPETDLMMKCLLNSVHIFHKPADEGLLAVERDFLKEIDDTTNYATDISHLARISISEKSKDYAMHVRTTAQESFYQIIDIITKAVKESSSFIGLAKGERNVFTDEYGIIKSLVPASMKHAELNRLEPHNNEYFVELGALRSLVNATSGLEYKDQDTVSAILGQLRDILEVFEEYAISSDKLELIKMQLQEYAYVLNQQFEYVKFFSQLCEVDIPDYSMDLSKVMQICRQAAADNLEQKVKSMVIESCAQEVEYYKTALNYCKLYDGQEWSHKLQAQVHCYFADLYAAAEDTHEALNHYLTAMNLNKTLVETYTKAGNLFFKEGKYEAAIECYKGVNNHFKIKACYKELIKLDPENPTLMMETGDYFAAIGRYEKAAKYYHDAFSLSNDEEFKATAWHKIAKGLKSTAQLAESYDQKADNHDFYNFDAADLAQLESALMGHNIGGVDH